MQNERLRPCGWNQLRHLRRSAAEIALPREASGSDRWQCARPPCKLKREHLRISHCCRVFSAGVGGLFLCQQFTMYFVLLCSSRSVPPLFCTFPCPCAMPTGSPILAEATIKLEEKMLQFELQLGQFSGVVSGSVEVIHRSPGVELSANSYFIM